MFNTNTLYIRKSNKNNYSVVRVLDAHPDTDEKVRVQTIQPLTASALYSCKVDEAKAAKTDQEIITVKAGSVKQSVNAVNEAAAKRENERPVITYLDYSGSLCESKDYSVQRDHAVIMDKLEGEISFTCTGCNKRREAATSSLRIEHFEASCECCGAHETIIAHVKCGECSTANDFDLYDS